jgi:hypothetical protein
MPLSSISVADLCRSSDLRGIASLAEGEMRFLAFALLVFATILACAPAQEDRLPVTFVTQEIDSKIKIGYGLAIGDVDGDRNLDILLADKTQLVWYRNPGVEGKTKAPWERHVIHDKATAQDNVCLAALDIDGDGKVEVALGAGWRPADTVASGSVHYMIPGEDRRQPWQKIDLHREPTVHRMHWVADGQGGSQLVVLPLHGRGNRRGQGEAVKVLAYTPPAEDRSKPWMTELIDQSMHVTHNFDPVQWDEDVAEELLLAGREGVVLLDRDDKRWRRTELVNASKFPEFEGAGEVRMGRVGGGRKVVATVEPFHGQRFVLYLEPQDGGDAWQRQVLCKDLAQGHAIACGDLDGDGSDECLVGWRQPNQAGELGIRIYTAKATQWVMEPLDGKAMACEDLRLADLDGDGDLDAIAAGRASHNLRIYWNHRRDD